MMGLDECLLGGECSCGSGQQDSFLELHSLSLMQAACCSYVCKKENISELSKNVYCNLGPTCHCSIAFVEAGWSVQDELQALVLDACPY